MPGAATVVSFLDTVRHSGVVHETALHAFLKDRPGGKALASEPTQLAKALVQKGLLTGYQANLLLHGKTAGLTIGKYRVLDMIGSGGMGDVYLALHPQMGRLVAIKVLPETQAEQPGAVERFYREAQAVGALNHPHIVRANDVDCADNRHFLVMEYVDGVSLQDLVDKHGPLAPERACHYTRQAALGLQHAHGAGWVHRDIKPGNLLLDRQGTVKILDMGLARFFRAETDRLTERFDNNCVLGTADYLAPEQALDSHDVDIRADLYSLGATLYFLLAGRSPFHGLTTAQKLLAHQMREPAPLRSQRPDVPEALAAVVSKLMAKDAGKRYQTPAEVVQALTPWTGRRLPLPSAAELPAVRTDAQRFQRAGATQRPSPVATPLPQPKAAPPRPVKRGWFLLAGVAACALGALGLTAWLLLPGGNGDPARPTAPLASLRVTSAAGPRALTPAEAIQQVGKVCTVEMVVKGVSWRNKNTTLLLSSEADPARAGNFNMVVYQAPDKLQKAGLADPERHFLGKTIRISGKVDAYNFGTTSNHQIVVTDLGEIAFAGK